MDTLFLSLSVILAGGLLALLLSRQFVLMKLVTIATVSAGCIIGLYSTLPRLLASSTAAETTLNWLHIFTLSFKIDSISSFFRCIGHLRC